MLTRSVYAARTVHRKAHCALRPLFPGARLTTLKLRLFRIGLVPYTDPEQTVAGGPRAHAAGRIFLRRVITLVALLFFAVPFGISLAGCGSSTSAAGQYCTGSSGPRVGQVQTVTLTPQVGDISLSYGQSTSITAPTATDCKGSSVTISSVTYSTGDAATNGILDVTPTGDLCAGTWNRNSAGSIANYSTCTPNNKTGVAYVTATAAGVGSNQVVVYVHPIVTDIELGLPSTDCVNDPATNCQQYASISVPVNTSVAAYSPNDCVSFGQNARLVARFYDGPASVAANNITYSAGHATFAPLTSGIVTVNSDNSGVFTASAPGSTIVTASIGPTSGRTTSNAGIVSVCPPKTITISTLNAVNNKVSVNVGSTESITANVVDTKGAVITGLSLTYESTQPVTTPASSSGIVPVFAGGAAVTAFCLPPTCNPAPLAYIGRYPNNTPSGNGKPISSNNIAVTTPGTSSSLIWVASTDSLYLLPLDLTTGTVPAPTRLPLQPNSMVLTQNGATIYLGSAQGIMTFTTSSNSVTSTNTSIQGPVLAASPDSTELVVTDPNRKTVSIYSPGNGTVVSSFAGVGTRAAFTPDGLSAYVTTADNHLLVYSPSTSWHQYDLSADGAVNDVVAAIPAVGAFVGTATAVNGRSYCPNTTSTVTDYYPQASNTIVSAAVADRLAATNDGIHLLDVRLATANSAPVVNDLLLGGGAGLPLQECPEDGSTPAFTTAVNTTVTGLTAGTVTGLYSATDSSLAVITNTAATGAPTTGAKLAVYQPSTTGAGSVSTVTLANGATAAVAGAISTDSRFFYAGTSGDNLLHYITLGTLTDTAQINPNLPSISTPTTTAQPNLIVLRPRTALVAGQ